MKIVEANINDAIIIRQIAEIVWPVAYIDILSKEQLTYMLQNFYGFEVLKEQMLTQGHQFFIAKDLDNAIGFASVSKEGLGAFKLQKLYVLPDYQGKHVGNALLKSVMDYCALKEGKSLILNVNRHNMARFFYEKQGFKIIKEVDIEIGEGYFMNDFVMERNI